MDLENKIHTERKGESVFLSFRAYNFPGGEYFEHLYDHFEYLKIFSLKGEEILPKQAKMSIAESILEWELKASDVYCLLYEDGSQDDIRCCRFYAFYPNLGEVVEQKMPEWAEEKTYLSPAPVS